MNIVILTGNLGADIEVKQSNGTDYAHFSVATNYRVRVGDGYEERTLWTRITAFNALARSLRRLGKGSKVAVRGRLQTRTFERDDVRFTYSEVIADEVEFQVVKPRQDDPDATAVMEAPPVDPDDDDIPF